MNRHHYRSTTNRLLIVGSLFTAAVAGTALAAELPETIEVTGVVRDFHERTAPDGHPDFERRPDRGFGRYSGNVSETLGEDGKPAFTGHGFKIASQWRDSEHRQICRTLYDPSLGDTPGNYAHESQGGISSEASFAMWFNDTPGMNISRPLSLVMVHQGGGRYVFDDKDDVYYKGVGFETMRGFFPIDDELFGNSAGTPNHNFHFTFELHLEFTYQTGDDQYFKFVGDDDVWVYINNELVIDLGGVHAAHDQYVDVNRLGLVDGESYTIDFFFAERHRTQSNFRIETNFVVASAEPPATTAAFD